MYSSSSINQSSACIEVGAHSFCEGRLRCEKMMNPTTLIYPCTFKNSYFKYENYQVAHWCMNKHILYLLDMTWTEFETEGVTESGNDHDYLMITTSSQSSIKLQGSALYIQNRFLCEENVSLQFVSDGFNNNKGFLVRYSGAPLLYSTALLI